MFEKFWANEGDNYTSKVHLRGLTQYFLYERRRLRVASVFDAEGYVEKVFPTCGGGH
jgi:hypothetical protein